LIPNEGLISEALLKPVQPLGRPVLEHRQVLQKSVFLRLLFQVLSEQESLVLISGHGGKDASLGADGAACTPIILVEKRFLTEGFALKVYFRRFKPASVEDFFVVVLIYHGVLGWVHRQIIDLLARQFGDLPI